MKVFTVMLGGCADACRAGGAGRPDHAVALLYHCFGEAAHPATNVELAQFEAHLDLLAADRYTVLPLIEIVRRLHAGDSLPERAVAITIDDARHSIFSEAWPRMRARGLPFTVFLETDALDEERPQSLFWEQVHEMAAAGVDFASHSASPTKRCAGPRARPDI